MGSCVTLQSRPASLMAAALVAASAMTVPSWWQAGSPATNTAARPVLRAISCATGFLLRVGKWDNQGVARLAGVVGRHGAEGFVGAVVEDLHPRHVGVKGGRQLEDLDQAVRVEPQDEPGLALGQDL